ncbi:hypothetical protein ACMD2_04152 [Ananas comosus]|uniref:Uncharacterized protein n=1 Tax=Ananas comosus TaxID=4615 RepID=A0A199W7M0_ANACO|nr:hypothetical protein ACMD2_04152 [Ananas comosus]
MPIGTRIEGKWRIASANYYLGITIRHFLDQATGWEPPRTRRGIELIAFSGQVDRNVGDSPQALLNLLTVTQEAELARWDDRREHMQLFVHLEFRSSQKR